MPPALCACHRRPAHEPLVGMVFGAQAHGFLIETISRVDVCHSYLPLRHRIHGIAPYYKVHLDIVMSCKFQIVHLSCQGQPELECKRG